jgi:acyl-CoA synthetase (AMP-forming)/AMP-acid ligase II
MPFRHPGYMRLEPAQEISTSGEILRAAAMRFPEKTGLICGARRWSFAEWDALANRFAHAIRDTATDDGPVAIMAGNCAEYAIAHFGTARSGRYAVNLPTRCGADELLHAVNLARPAFLVLDDKARAMMDACWPQFDRKPELLAIEPRSGETPFWSFLQGGNAAAPEAKIDPDAPGSLIFTGGTTGRPKAVLATQRARAISAMAAVEDFRIAPDTIAGYSVPLTHTAGLFSWFQPAVLAGCTGVMIPKWDPEAFTALAEEHAISMIFAVPSQLAILLDHPGFTPERLRSLKRIVFGGAPISRALIERAEAVMPWLECDRAYGSSETGHLAAQIKSDRAEVYDGYNQPGGRLEIEIFKEPGGPADIGEIGEVATRGPHLMTGYLGDEEATGTFFRRDSTDGDWGWMGDLALRHEGYFSVVGRSKHMILSGGLNIFPAELEEHLATHGEVADCAVFAMEDDVWGELPVAAVVARNDSMDVEEVMDFVAGRVARHKRLRRIFLVGEIPRTPAGKAQVHLLKAQCLGVEEKDL